MHQRIAALAGQRGELEHRALPAQPAHDVLHPRLALDRIGQHVELVEHQPARLLVERLVVLLQFPGDRADLGDRIDVLVERHRIDQVQQHAGALQVAQEQVAQAGALGGALDQARHVGDDEALARTDAHDTQVRMQRGEGIVGDLRPRVRDRGDQRRLAGVGHAQQADIGQHAQLQLERLDLAGPARGLLARRAVGAGLEVQVAEAAVAALGQDDLLAVLEQLGDDLLGLGVADDRAHRHAQHHVLASGAELVRAATGLAIARLVAAGVAEIDQRVQVAVAQRVDMAAAAAVAAIGAAKGNELLAPEARAAGTTVSGGHVDRDLIDKFHACSPDERSLQCKKPRHAGASCA